MRKRERMREVNREGERFVGGVVKRGGRWSEGDLR